MDQAGAIFFNVVLAMAAVCDLRWWRIPNILPLLLALGAVVMMSGGVNPVPFLMSLAIVGPVVVALFVAGFMGGGDTKLLMAAALWIPVPDLPLFAMCLGVAAGLQGLAVLAWIRAVPGVRPQRGTARRRQMPFALSIAAAGAAWTLLNVVWM